MSYQDIQIRQLQEDNKDKVSVGSCYVSVVVCAVRKDVVHRIVTKLNVMLIKYAQCSLNGNKSLVIIADILVKQNESYFTVLLFPFISPACTHFILKPLLSNITMPCRSTYANGRPTSFAGRSYFVITYNYILFWNLYLM